MGHRRSDSGSGPAPEEDVHSVSPWGCTGGQCAACGSSCLDCSKMALTSIDCSLPLDIQLMYANEF